MSQTLALVQDLVKRRDVRISDHGYDELAADNIFVNDIIGGVDDAVVAEDYPEYAKGPCVLPEYAKGPCVLALQKDKNGKPIHVVWGIPKNAKVPAVLVTAYRPDAEHWTADFLRRR